VNAMMHKGYAARINFDSDDKLFVGRIAGINDIVGFHGDSVDALTAAFEEAVDDYLAACAKLGKPPEKPYSGKVMFRIKPEIHARAAMAAQLAGKSLNQWAEDVLEKAV
jgi:predicted HicB family RNase H-like nuclease